MKELAENTPLDISDKILLVRHHRVVLDETLAALYGVETRSLNQAVRRNRDRLPEDFLIEINPEEWEILRSQIVILRSGHGRHRKYPPLAFTEHGAIMAAAILNSPRAIQCASTWFAPLSGSASPGDARGTCARVEGIAAISGRA